MLQRWAYRLQAFMYGRNGVDQLCWLLLILGIILNLIGNFTGRVLISALAYVPMVWALFRMFSKNLPQRQKENAWLLRLLHQDAGSAGSAGAYTSYQNAGKKTRVGFTDRLKDKDHKYFRCPKCCQTVRVPKGKGVIRITCPKCGERFEKKT